MPVNSNVMSQVPSVRFELLMDRVLDDGRIVVINSSADGHSGPDHTTLASQGAFDVPLGTVFSALVSRESSDGDEGYVERQIGTVENLALRVGEIEFFRRLIDTIPNGHNAAVRFDGEGIELVRGRMLSKQKKLSHYLVANGAET